MFDFPNSPTVGQIVTAPSGASYQYDGLKWIAYNAGAVSSGDITGVAAGHGLTGGGTSGDVTVALATPVALADGGTGATTAGAALAALGGAPLASAAFTGNPTAPTPSPGDNDTSIATTAFVAAAVVAGGGISDAPNDGTLYGRKSAAWSHPAFSDITGSASYAQLPTEVAQVPIVFPYVGKPAASLAVNVPMAMAMTLAANFAGSVGFATTPPAATATFTVARVVSGTPTTIGTIAIATSGVFTFTAASPTSFAIGDVLRVTAPSSQDSALADLAITLMASRT